jgi:hypothetical protein
MEFIFLDGKTVAVIEVKPSSEPVGLNKEGIRILYKKKWLVKHN